MIAHLMLAGTLLLPSPTPLTTQDSTPESTATAYMQAVQHGRWADMASLMHPEALTQLRTLMEPLFSSKAPEADDFRQQFLGVRTVREAAALSDTTVFANFVRAINDRNPTAAEALRAATIDVIGHVGEGPDVAYVVYRATLDVEGMTISNVNVLTVKRWGDGWRVLLSGDYSALATALRQALGG
jgi:hypothetical protein